MTAPSSIDPAAVLHEHLAQASPDLMRELLSTFIDALLSADADAVCRAGWGEVPHDNRRTCYGRGARLRTETSSRSAGRKLHAVRDGVADAHEPGLHLFEGVRGHRAKMSGTRCWLSFGGRT